MEIIFNLFLSHRELRSRRHSERWSAEVDHLRDLTSSQAKKIDQLEEELVRMENQIEQKQLDWETKQIQLENLDEGMDYCIHFLFKKAKVLCNIFYAFQINTIKVYYI